MLEAKCLSKTFHTAAGFGAEAGRRVAAVKKVSLKLEPGRTLGIVGESGSGKSTLAKLLTLLVPPDEGELLFEGKPLAGAGRAELKRYRRGVQIIFQDPYASLNPRMTVREVLEEPFVIHGQGSSGDRRREAAALLPKVGLPAAFLDRRPRQLSGGERQRVSIARAIALKPRLLICDEPVSSLDVLVQAQILNLFLALQREDGIGYAFISHDLRVVRHMSDRLIVMQDGAVVEEGEAGAVLENPKDPTTRRLVDSLHLDDLAGRP